MATTIIDSISTRYGTLPRRVPTASGGFREVKRSVRQEEAKKARWPLINMCLMKYHHNKDAGRRSYGVLPRKTSRKGPLHHMVDSLGWCEARDYETRVNGVQVYPYGKGYTAVGDTDRGLMAIPGIKVIDEKTAKGLYRKWYVLRPGELAQLACKGIGENVWSPLINNVTYEDNNPAAAAACSSSSSKD